MKMEFGDYYDNFEALQFAQRQIHMGRVQEGLEVLRGLRKHILQISDTKSERYLLPNIDFYENTATEHGSFTCFETKHISAALHVADSNNRRVCAFRRGLCHDM